MIGEALPARCAFGHTRREMLGANILGANCNHKIDASQQLNADRVRPEGNRQEKDQTSAVSDQKPPEPQIARPRSVRPGLGVMSPEQRHFR